MFMNRLANPIADLRGIRNGTRLPVSTFRPCQDDFAQAARSGVILCVTTTNLFDLFTGTSKECAVTERVRPTSIYGLDAGLSLRRAIRANFASCVGIPEGDGGRQRRRPTITC
jgi:hypothetical protein